MHNKKNKKIIIIINKYIHCRGKKDNLRPDPTRTSNKRLTLRLLRKK